MDYFSVSSYSRATNFKNGQDFWPTQYKDKTESEQYKTHLNGLVYMLGVTFFS